MSGHASGKAFTKKREEFQRKHPYGRKVFSLRKKISKRRKDLEKLMRNPSEEDDKKIAQLEREIEVMENKIKKLGRNL